MASRAFDKLFRKACREQAGVWRDAIRLGRVMPYESAVDLVRTARALYEAGELYREALERIQQDSTAVAALRRKVEGRPLSAASVATLAMLKEKFPW